MNNQPKIEDLFEFEVITEYGKKEFYRGTENGIKKWQTKHTIINKQPLKRLFI